MVKDREGDARTEATSLDASDESRVCPPQPEAIEEDEDVGDGLFGAFSLAEVSSPGVAGASTLESDSTSSVVENLLADSEGGAVLSEDMSASPEEGTAITAFTRATERHREDTKRYITVGLGAVVGLMALGSTVAMFFGRFNPEILAVFTPMAVLAATAINSYFIRRPSSSAGEGHR